MGIGHGTLIGPAILPAMPQPQDEDDGIGNLVAQLVTPHDDATDLTGCIGVQLLTDAGEVDKPIRGMRELLDDLGRGVRRDRFKKCVQAHKIR